jgi:type IV secretion system protein TrbL
VAEPARAFVSEPTDGEAASSSGGSRSGGWAAGVAPEARPAATLARESAQARSEFHRAASTGRGGATPRPQGRAAALQAFFVANTGRGLMPGGENSGVLSPNLKTEES